MKRVQRVWSSLPAILLLWGSATGAGLFAFGTQVILARGLPKAEFGALVTAITITNVLAALAGFGIGGVWLRVFGAEGSRAIRWVRPSLRLFAIGNAVALLALIAGSLLGGLKPAVRYALWLLAPWVVAQSLGELAQVRFQLEERYAAVALWQALPHLARLSIAAIVLAVGGGFQGVVWSFGFGALILTLGGVATLTGVARGVIRLAGHPVPPSAHEAGSSRRIGETLSLAWPFAMAGVSYMVYYQSDIAILGWIVGVEAAAIYGVAYSVLAVVYILPSALYLKFLLPKLHRWAGQDYLHFARIARLGTTAMFVSGVIAMGAVMLFAPSLVPLIFGEEFRDTSQVVLALAWAIPLRFGSVAVGSLLAALGLMRKRAGYTLITAVGNLALNLALIPIYGIGGAVFSTVVSEFFLFSMYLNAWRGHSAVHGAPDVTGGIYN